MAVLERKTVATSDESGLRKFTYRDLLEMEKWGIIGEDEHVELLGGHIFKMTIKPPHAFVTTELVEAFTVAFVENTKIASQTPLRLSDDLDSTELPEPDVMLLERQYYLEHPKPENVLLLVEVSDSTLRKDKMLKLPLYARAEVPEVWLVNLIQRRIEVYTEPKDGEYARRVNEDLTATLAPTAFPDTAQQWLPDEVLELLDKHDL